MPVSCLGKIIEIPDDKLKFSSSSRYFFSEEATQTKGDKHPGQRGDIPQTLDM